MDPIPNVLSLWEVAHRWHDAIPSASDESSVTREIRDTLLALIEQVAIGNMHPYYTTTVWEGEGEQKHSPSIYGFQLQSVPEEFQEMFLSGVLQRETLQAYSVSVETIFHWCNSAGYEPPDFCIPASAFVSAKVGAVAPPPAETRPETEDAAKTARSALGQKAALARHEPVQKIKDALFAYWDAGDFSSQAQAVRRFMNNRSEESLRPLSPTNAERTLKEALSKHVRSKPKP